MLWVPQKGKLRIEHTFGTASTGSITATTGASASTKGSVAEIIASTSFDSYMIAIMASQYGASATASEGALDILVGAATERVLIPNLLMGYCGGNTADNLNGCKIWLFPLYIPAGTRIACQAAGARTATAVRVGIKLWGGDGFPKFRVGTKVTTYGMGTVPNGTTITPGASGAQGSWTQITASTGEDNFAFVPSFQVAADTTTNNRYLSLDLGIGAATEQVIGDGHVFMTNATEHMAGPFPCFPVYHDVPAGTRLVMRASCNSTIDGGYNGVIHAVS